MGKLETNINIQELANNLNNYAHICTHLLLTLSLALSPASVVPLSNWQLFGVQTTCLLLSVHRIYVLPFQARNGRLKVVYIKMPAITTYYVIAYIP